MSSSCAACGCWGSWALCPKSRSGASADLRAVLAGDMEKWGRLVKERNIQIAQ